MNLSEFLGCVSWDDPETTIRRFSGNEQLLIRFLKKFPSDQTFTELERAVKESDYNSVLTAAHTLKGLSGNLGFTTLCNQCADLVNCLRTGDTKQTAVRFNNIEDTYYTIIDTLALLD